MTASARFASTPKPAIPEYWIDNLVDWCLEVYGTRKTEPMPLGVILKEGDSVSPLSSPDASIPVASLFPNR